jgi:hypothetical protein
MIFVLMKIFKVLKLLYSLYCAIFILATAQMCELKVVETLVCLIRHHATEAFWMFTRTTIVFSSAVSEYYYFLAANEVETKGHLTFCVYIDDLCRLPFVALVLG